MGMNLRQNDDGSADFVNDLDSKVVLQMGADNNIVKGSYSSPQVANSDTDTMLSYHAESAGGDSGGYLYTIFSSAKGAATSDNLIGIHNTAHVPTGGSPKTVQAIQGHVYVESGGSLATRGGDLTAGMYGAWFKAYMDVGATLDSGSYAAAIWLDNQLNGTKNGTTYSIFSSSGATTNAWAGFADDAAGWTNLFLWEDTNTPPVSAGGSGDISFSGTWHKIAVDIGGSTFYLVASASPS